MSENDRIKSTKKNEKEMDGLSRNAREKKVNKRGTNWWKTKKKHTDQSRIVLKPQW